ncbi:hypothetical protein PHLGIDRAFT_260971 [Phlebiopsis gigantea 11061_1 CR5-6]|uniref:Uncharacterized protein n=1 Tax=Phlebiopsis gigantea (strain 11061_1 CR5-6) TaxID=745531 RepID=A0A0C3P3L9_PHLG1|nr:hypothetical protein PHLGIDRAFT_260971 [Phlebiopsis gigantea 11061_1 CR5-6]
MNAPRADGRNEESLRLFQELKRICVPLLSKSHLTPSVIPEASGLLTRLIEALREAQTLGQPLTPSLISYVFFPISTILRRNNTATLPDQVLEKVLTVLSVLCEQWWWDMDVQTWEQIFMLCGAIVGSLDNKGKSKRRGDETLDAAVNCLWVILHERSPEDAVAAGRSDDATRSPTIFAKFQSHSRTRTFIPIIGQTVSSMLETALSQHLPLQRISLKSLRIVIEKFLSDEIIPAVLPGVVSTMCKISLATSSSKRWANGNVVALSLAVTESVIVRAIGDDICVQNGIVHLPTKLEDLTELGTERPIRDDTPSSLPYTTQRTSSWLKGTSSQLHIALNSLNSLVNHPSSTALTALASFSATVLRSTSLTLPQSTPLLLSYLLSLSLSDFAVVSDGSKAQLVELCKEDSPTRHTFIQALLQIAKDHLMHLPRLIPTQSDVRVEHSAGVLEAICNLAVAPGKPADRGLRVVTSEVGKLLGPNGGIERWGWNLLSVLDLTVPSLTVAATSAAQLMLESDAQATQWSPFPKIALHQVSSPSAQHAIERMFRALGRAAQDDGLFAAEWFFGIGRASNDSRATTALWCGSRLLEGIAGVSLDIGDGPHILPRRKRLEKFARWLAKVIPELWDDENNSPSEAAEAPVERDTTEHQVEHIKGLVQIRAPAQVGFVKENVSRRPAPSPFLHRALALQALAICAGILQTSFTHLLLHTLYPILNALISEHDHLSSTALATLHYITYCTSYASPANLLLSNFDYALDAVSRKLNRRWLDVDATRVLVVLVRLVGRDVVQKAGDVVEECFDRLDEYHGYEIVVDGLVAVLLEVVVVIGSDEENLNNVHHSDSTPPAKPYVDSEKFPEFCAWFSHRHDKPDVPADDESDSLGFGPVPRKAWDELDEDEEKEAPQTAEDPLADPPPTPTQALTKLIVSRSLYFLTHRSPLIRARILFLLSSAVPVLPSSALLESVHYAWPFVLNRLSDPEPYVVRAAATLIEALAVHVGGFMYRRVWDDIWPRFRDILRKLEAEDATNALARRGPGAVGTSSAYTHSHRLYTAVIRTLTASVKGVKTQSGVAWEVIVACRRFLHAGAHEELQASAVSLYKALSDEHEDSVWLALSATAGELPSCSFLHEPRWDIAQNVQRIFP